MKIIVLHNPTAGRGRARRRLASALEVLRGASVDLKLRESRSAAHLVDLACRARDEQPDIVVSVGGDGTHHYVLNGLAGGDIPLGLLPLGSGNDFANCLGVPVETTEAARALLTGRPWSIDLARVGATLYGCIAGAGFDSIVTRFANEQVRWVQGSPAYAWAILRCLKFLHPHRFDLRSESTNYSGNFIFTIVGNTPSYGGGVRMAPFARLDDGLLDVCIVPEMGKLELLRWVPRAYRGEHLLHPRIVYFQARSITLESMSRLELFGDGEFIQELPAKIEVVPRALQVIVPQQT